MKRGVILVLVLLIIALSHTSFGKECVDLLKPKINLSTNEELYVNHEFYKDITNQKLKLFNYYEINSTFSEFFIDKTNPVINITPTLEDYGKHSYLFFAIDKNECYSALFVTFTVYDTPRIIPLRPKEDNIEIIEGDSILFAIDVDDRDKDIKNYLWTVNDIKQKGDIKDKFPFITNLSSKGAYNISVIVTDSKKLSDNYTWHIKVNKNNKAPYSTSPFPDFALSNNDKITTQPLDLYFKDPNNDKLSYTFKAKDENGNIMNISTFIDEKNQLTIKPLNDYYGIIYIEIKATDESGDFVSSNVFKLYVFKKDVSQTFDKNMCGDLVCSKNETCSNCKQDCGPCTNNLEKCVNDWMCTPWSDCLSPGYIVRFCNDKNICIDTTQKPKTYDACEFLESCFDGLKNQQEIEIDCGGPCDPCPSCHDNKKNQGEDKIDCGGPCNSCPTCFDGRQNQFESDIDCGGPCDLCLDLKKCYSYKDCESHVCKNGICQTPTCLDRITNGKEENVDCGKACGTLCPTCIDGIKNQDEEKTDCGGVCDPCETCFDSTKNQNEIYPDCGGVCKSCTWSDFKENNTKLILILQILLLIILLPISIIIFSLMFKKYFGKNNIDRIILIYKIFGEKKLFKDNKELIHSTLLKMKKLQRDIVDSPKKSIKYEFVNLISVFLKDIFSIDYVNDEKTILEKLKSQKIGYPLNILIIHLAKEAKNFETDKYLSNIDLIVRIDKIDHIIKEIDKKI